MRILHINTADQPGGAEVVACKLVEGMRSRGHEAWLAAGIKRGSGEYVINLDERSTPLEKLRASLTRHYRKRRGHEVYTSATSWRLPELAPDRPDILHAHNLHGLKGYFDLRALPMLSERFPFFMTLQDSWLLSGHCAHSFDCERWKIGCGECPDLTIYPSLRTDGTAFNWKLKQNIFARSKLYIATPCQWLLDKVQQSMLAPGMVEGRVIPNGVDLSVFKPTDQRDVRLHLGLPLDAPIVLFAASALKHNIFKDDVTLREAIRQIAESPSGRKVLFLALGAAGADEKIGCARIQFTGYVPDHNAVAAYFQAADCFLHAARADTYPNVILESSAAGCPVVATGVCGIPEQIIDGSTGFLVAKGDAAEMAEKTRLILTDAPTRRIMGEAAARLAQERFGMDRQISAYLEWYQAALDNPQDAKRTMLVIPWKIPRIERGTPPRFTVTAIVSTYKSEEFIRGCMEDLVEQTLFKRGEVEILVIDSGSPENERAVVEEFQKHHSNVVYVRTEREPLYTAWNRALRMAHGRYISNANTDDRHRADAYEVMAAALDNRPEVALVYGDMVLTQTPNAKLGTAPDEKLYPWAPFSVAGLLGEERCGPHPMWRRDLHYDLGGFIEEFKVASDYEWWLRLASKHPLYHIPQPLGLYLKRPESIEHRQLAICEQELESIRRYYIRALRIDPGTIRLKPKAAIPRFFWRMRRSVAKRLQGHP
jgi:glycosyltransferase involved in cell wall biosynthesis